MRRGSKANEAITSRRRATYGPSFDMMLGALGEALTHMEPDRAKVIYEQGNADDELLFSMLDVVGRTLSFVAQAKVVAEVEFTRRLEHFSSHCAGDTTYFKWIREALLPYMTENEIGMQRLQVTLDAIEHARSG